MFFWRGVVQVTIEGSMKTFFELRGATMTKALVGETNGFWEHEFFWMLLVGVLVWIVLNRHQFGAHVYLIGDNEASARLMGWLRSQETTGRLMMSAAPASGETP